LVPLCWSSARHRIGKDSGGDFKIAPMLQMAVDDWENYWNEAFARRQAMDEFLAAEDTKGTQ
jgi:hypothetical protein